jgi:hypothetical protein
MSDIDIVTNTYQNHEKVLAEANSLNKTVVFDALAEASITSATVTFDGGGDSGQIGEITAVAGDITIPLPDVQITMQRASWNSGKLEIAQTSLRDAIEELCFDCLSQEHGGWENNDGGQGEFTFHVQDCRIELDFQQFYTDSTHYSHTF